MAAHAAPAGGRLLPLPVAEGRSGVAHLVGGGRAQSAAYRSLLPAPCPLRAAHGGAGDARSGIGAPAVGEQNARTNTDGIDIMLAHRRIGIDAGARLPPRPPRSGQGGGRIVHLRPLRRPDRTGGLRGRSLHAEPADRRPVDAAHVAGARAQRVDRGRHGHRQRTGDGHQPPARERCQIEGHHPADRRREQPRRDRSGHGGRNRQGAGHPGLHDRSRDRAARPPRPRSTCSAT